MSTSEGGSVMSDRRAFKGGMIVYMKVSAKRSSAIGRAIRLDHSPSCLEAEILYRHYAVVDPRSAQKRPRDHAEK